MAVVPAFNAGLGQARRKAPAPPPTPGPGALGGNQGAQMGRLAQAADGLRQATDRVATREDAIARVRAVNSFDQDAQAELARLETEGDLTQSEIVSQYRDYLKQRQGDLLKEYSGPPDGLAALTTRLEGLRGGYASEMVTRNLKAQRELVTSHIDTTVNRVAQRVYQDPGSFDEALIQFDDELKQLAGSLTAGEERAYRAGGRSRLAISTAEAMLDRGDVDAAEEFVNRPDVAEVMSAGSVSQIRQRASQQRNAQNEYLQEFLGQQSVFRAAFGREPSDLEMARMLGVAPEAEPLVEVADPDNPGRGKLVPRSQAAGMNTVGPSQSLNLPTGYMPAPGGGAMPIPGTPQAMEQQQAARASRQQQIAREQSDMAQGQAVVGSINRVFDAMDSGITDAVGPLEGSLLMNWLPGSNTRQVAIQLEAIQANIGFDRLQAMRDASPTGGALGAVSQMELARLEASTGALTTELPADVFAERMVEVGDGYARVMFGSDAELQLAVETGDMTKAQAIAAADQRDAMVDTLRSRAAKVKGEVQVAKVSAAEAEKRTSELVKKARSNPDFQLTDADMEGLSDAQLDAIDDAWMEAERERMAGNAGN